MDLDYQGSYTKLKLVLENFTHKCFKQPLHGLHDMLYKPPTSIKIISFGLGDKTTNLLQEGSGYKS